MILPKLSIKNYQFTIVVFVLLTILGVINYINMPRMENPEVTIPGGSIVAFYPGANPVDLEQLVATPIEDIVNELEDIKKINTTLKDGIAVINVEFEYGTDPDEKYDEMVRSVNSIRNDLPENLYDLRVHQWKSSDVVLKHLALASNNIEYAELKRIAEKLKNDIKKIYGVRKVDITACPEQEIRISLDFEKMAAMNIPLERVSGAIKSNNANIPGGELKLGGKNFSIKTSGAFKSLEDIRNTVVSSYQGKNIFLKTIATVKFTDEDPGYYARVNMDNRKQYRAIFIEVKQKEGLNIFKIDKRIEPVIANFRKTLGNNLQLFTIFDQTEEVDEKISGFIKNLIQGIIIVGIVILLALGRRSSLIVIIAIPLSIIIGLSFLNLFGYGIEQISIAGLVIALGLLVDNSIVMIENINRFIKMGYKPKEAAINAAAEIGWPIVSATVTTLLAFAPIVAMPDKSGDFIRSMPVTVLATLTVSLFIALSLTPMIAGLTFKATNNDPQKKKKKENGLLQKFIDGPYRRTLRFAIDKKHGRRITVTTAFLLLIFSLSLFSQLGKSLFPKAEKPQFLIKINLPEGTNLQRSDQAATYVESVLDTIEEVELFVTNIGHGNTRIYYNEIPSNKADNFAEIFVKLNEYKRQNFDRLIVKLRKCFNEYPGAKISVKEFEQGAPVESLIEVYIHGYNNETLNNIAEEVKTQIEKRPGAINLENQLAKKRTNLHINIHRNKANMFGVPVSNIDMAIRTAVAGSTISEYRDDDGNEYDMVLRLPFEDRISIKDLDKIHVASLSGKMIPVKQLAKIEFQEAPGIITRYNLERSAKITGDIAKGANIDKIMEPVIRFLDNYPFPPGYSYHIGGELENRADTFGGLSNAIIIALISIFAVLVLQFKSFVQPLIIYMAIPLAAIGAILALFITGNSFSFTAGIGFTSLIGIVINNSIILVDYSNQLVKKGMSITEAVKTAGETRFTPIILTTLTTIGGLLPLTLGGGSLWAPMGWTIIGGLLVSTGLTLIIVPVFYTMLTKNS